MGILDKPARGIICTKCGDFIISRHRHHYISCKCRSIAIDGGQSDYYRICISPGVKYLWATEKPKKENK